VAGGEVLGGGQRGAAAAAAVPSVLGALGSGRLAGELRLGRRNVEEVLELQAAGRSRKFTAAARPARRRAARSG
jgi:hypothetical protein